MKTDWGEAPVDCFYPDWKNPQKVHDWKNYVSERVQSLWPHFTNEMQVQLAANFQDIADQEEWD